MKPITERENKKKCFIIMPISTPENWLSKYSNDQDHFKHVLEHLIIPSLEKVNLEPIPPITKGSEVIQGQIIKNIETADLVLCDMSILNPNVFFELGIRTALNKSVCLIKDDIAPKIPFDTSIINNHTYSSSLAPWILEKEIDNLVKHIKESMKIGNGANSLWKYFSLSSTAHPAEPENGIEGRLNFLTMQIEALRNHLIKNNFNDSLNKEIMHLENLSNNKKSILNEYDRNSLLKEFMKLSDENEGEIKFLLHGGILIISYPQTKLLPKSFLDKAKDIAEHFGVDLEFEKY